MASVLSQNNKTNKDAVIKLKSEVESVLTDNWEGVVIGSFWNAYQKRYHKLPDPKLFGVLKRSQLLDLCTDVYTKVGSDNSAILYSKRPPKPAPVVDSASAACLPLQSIVKAVPGKALPAVVSSNASSTSTAGGSVKLAKQLPSTGSSAASSSVKPVPGKQIDKLKKENKEVEKKKSSIASSVQSSKSEVPLTAVDTMNSRGSDNNAFYDRFYGASSSSAQQGQGSGQQQQYQLQQQQLHYDQQQALQQLRQEQQSQQQQYGFSSPRGNQQPPSLLDINPWQPLQQTSFGNTANISSNTAGNQASSLGSYSSLMGSHKSRFSDFAVPVVPSMEFSHTGGGGAGRDTSGSRGGSWTTWNRSSSRDSSTSESDGHDVSPPGLGRHPLPTSLQSSAIPSRRDTSPAVVASTGRRPVSSSSSSNSFSDHTTVPQTTNLNSRSTGHQAQTTSSIQSVASILGLPPSILGVQPGSSSRVAPSAGGSARGSTSRVGRHTNYTTDQLNRAAEDCIERLAAAKDYVSREKIEKLLLQHFEVESLNQLGLNNLEILSCVNERNRLECKINLFIQNFVKIRSVCTLHELHECMRDFTPNRADFDSLKLGPLAKQPLVYQFFKAAPDSDICELTTADVIEYMRQYLTEKSLWTAKLELEPFLQFVVEKRQLTNPYELGLRMSSPALLIQTLKKAQRDTGQIFRKTQESLKQVVEDELTAAFRNFMTSVIERQAGTEMCAVRRQYLDMDSRQVTILVFNKLRQLYHMVGDLQLSWEGDTVGAGKARQKKLNTIQNVINSFTAQIGSDPLMQKLFQVAVCCSVEEIHTQQFIRTVSDNSIIIDSDDETRNTDLPPISQVIDALRKYLERVIAHGPVTLDKLAQIETRLSNDFNYQHFTAFGRGTFLDFLLRDPDIKKTLDEFGGSLLSTSSSHSALTESAYHATNDDLTEFIKQCSSKEHTVIEAAVCRHYACKEVRSLGHGSVAALLKSIEKRQQHRNSREPTVYYESALVAKQLSPVHGQERSTGVQGHVTRERALTCLQTCPLLVDMAEWSHWDLVFKPQLKDLKDFIQKHGGVNQCTVQDGARKVLLKTDILALEVRPGTLLRLTYTTSPEKFAAAAEAGDSRQTVGHLVSIIATNHSLDAAPLALLGNHVKTALMKMQAKDTGFREDMSEVTTQSTVRFILDCLTISPLLIGHLVLQKVFLDALSYVVGQVRSKQLLLEHATTVEQLSRLQVLGMLLGVSEWTDSFQLRGALPREFVEPLDEDMEAEDTVYVSNTSDDDDDVVDDIEPDDNISLSSDSSDNDDDDDDDVVIEEVVKSEVTDDVKATASVPAAGEVLGVVTGDVAAAATATVETVATDDADVGENIAENEPKNIEVIDVDSSDSSDRDAAVKTEIATVESADTCDVIDDVTTAVDDTALTSLSAQREFIERLRHEEFGENIELSDDGRRLMNKQQERLGRSLERLSSDLYSKDTHFVLELIQNADDNDYNTNQLQPDVPSLRFHVTTDSITVYNNETGFQELNIRAVCDVGKTTKGKHKFGYIGQKGIGFKSVFRVTDRPEIHSNGFHIRFDVHSSPLGYILPHWIDEPDEQLELENWMTCIRLPLKSTMRDRVASLTMAARFRDIQPSLLLFLHRLRCLTIYNQVESYEVTMLRRDVGENIVEITHGNSTDSWLVVRKVLDASKISLQAKSGVEIESTELAIAFPLLPKTNATTQALPPKQPVFAFLPLRSYGLRFIVQGDFDVPSSREEVDRDSMWNQWLRSEIASVFVSSLDVFKSHGDLSPVEAVSQFIQFVPSEDEILDFFRPVARNILQQLRAIQCLPTQGLQWRLPSQLVVTSDPLVRDVVSSSLLRQHLDYDYLHRGVAAILNSQLLQSLGVQTLNTQHLLEVGKTIVSGLCTSQCNDEVNEVEIVSVSKWLLCVYKSMDEFGQNEETLSTLRRMRFIALSSGRVTCAENDVVFFPLSSAADKSGGCLPILERDINTVNPLLLGEGVASSQITRLLEQLGVKHLTPRDIVQHHILPTLRSDHGQSKSRELLVTYLVYLMEQGSSVDINELKSVAVVHTNHGFRRPADEPIHFSSAYLNPVDLKQHLPGFDWTLVDACYLDNAKSAVNVTRWRSFLSSLGVIDFLAVKKKEVTLKLSELAGSVWSDYVNLLPVCDEYVIHDYECEEFAALVTLNTQRETLLQQMNYLFQYLDKDWDRIFQQYTITQIFNTSNVAIREVETSFGLLVKKSSWIPSVFGTEQRLARGSELFIKSSEALRLLSSHVTYLQPTSLPTSTFATYLGIKNDISIGFVADLLKSWCVRAKPSSPASFSTSLSHMRSLYNYLNDNMTRRQLDDLLSNFPVIFYTSHQSPNSREPVTGEFLSCDEVVWTDTSQLFTKYRDTLVDVIPSSGTCLYRYPLQPVYPDMEEFFTRTAHVRVDYDVNEFAQLLVHISNTSTVQRSLPDILKLYSILGRHLLTSGHQGHQGHLELLRSEKVIAGKDGRWLGLDCHPMIADDRKLEKLFPADAGVFFVDCGEKLGIGNTRKKSPLYKDIDLECIHKLLSCVGVQRLVDCLSIEPTTVHYKPCPALQLYVRQVVPWIQKQLYSEFVDTYQFLVETGAKARLAAMRFAQVGKLELVHSLKNRPDVTPVVYNEECRLVNNEELYVHCDHVTSFTHINAELARYFSCSNAPNCPDTVLQQADNCFRQIKALLGEIQPLLQSHSAQLDDLMESHNLEELPDSEELWEVKEPIIPVALPPMPKYYVGGGDYGAGLLQTVDMDTSETAAETGLKSWPPKSHSSGAPVPGVKGAVSMWPPPAPVEPVDRSQLPANLRPSSLPRPSHAGDSEMTEPQSVAAAESDGNTEHRAATDRDNTGNSGDAKHGTGEHRQLTTADDVAGSTGKRTGNATPGNTSKGDGSSTGDVKSPTRSKQPTTPHDTQTSQSTEGASLPTEGANETKTAAAEDNEDVYVVVDDVQKTGTAAVQNASESESTDTDANTIDDDEPLIIEFSSGNTVGNTGEDLLIRAGHKRARINSGTSQNDLIVRQSYSVKRPITFYGPPVWLSNDDNIYEALGTATSLTLPSDLSVSEESSTRDIGDWGELLVKNYLENLMRDPESGITEVSWMNSGRESGLPYDFVVRYRDESFVYIEVKSTVSEHKACFEFSLRQVMFAHESGSMFQLYRVYCAGNPHRVRLMRIDNIAHRLETKQLRLFMAI